MTGVAVVLISMLAVAIATGSMVRAGRMTKAQQIGILAVFGVVLLVVAGLAWHNSRA